MITWEDKEDVRQSNLPRKNRITADDMNEIKLEFNRVKTFDAIVSYTGVISVGVNDIGSVSLSNPISGTIRLSFPSGSFTDRIVTAQFTVGESVGAYRLLSCEVIDDSVNFAFQDLSGNPFTGAENTFVTIKSYPND
jgi:hypothetical protein